MNTGTKVRGIVAGVMVVVAAGCTIWRVQGVSPAMVVSQDQPRVVRITNIDSSQIIVNAPRVTGDSLTGETRDGRYAVPLTDVAYVALRRGDGAKTAGLVLLGAFGALLGLAALIAATW